MRPGESKILLNINTATTAFYLEVTLARWILTRWPKCKGVLLAHAWHKVDQLRVVFEADRDWKKRVVRGIGKLAGVQQLQMEGNVTTILKHMVNSQSP